MKLRPEDDLFSTVAWLYVLNCANDSIRHTRLRTVLSKGARELNIFHISNHTRNDEKICFYFLHEDGVRG